MKQQIIIYGMLLLFTIEIKKLIHISQIIYRKLQASDNSQIIANARQIIRCFRNLKEAFQKQGVTIPSIVKKISNKLTIFQQKYQQYQEKGAEPQSQQPLKQPLIVESFTKELSFKKIYFQKKIEAEKALKSQLTINEIQNIIQHQKDVCLGCLKTLEEGKLIPKTTQLFSLVKGTQINGVLQDNIKKKVCALLNEQGGYLFINQSSKDNVKGLKLNNEELYQLRLFVIKTINNSIFPNTFEIIIDKIEVIKHNTQIAKKSILRVSLRGNGIYFVKKEVQNYPPVYSCYFLDLNAVGKIDDICVLEKPEGIYKILTKHTYLKSTEKIIQKFNCIGRSNAMQNLLNQIDRKYPKLMNLEKIFDTGPKISYLNQTTLILPSDDDDKYIPLIKRAFEEYKMQFVFSKSYELCRSNSMKSMWFISHQQDLSWLHPIIADVIANKNKTFTLITCTKYLLIEKKQLSSLKAYLKTFQSYFQKDLKTIYGELIDTPYKEQCLFDIYIKFESFSEAYFSFMLLDDHRIRSKFVKQNKFKSLKLLQLKIN